MVLVPSPKFFILSVLLSGLLVNGMIVPSFAVPPIPTVCDSCATHQIFQRNLSPLKQFKDGIPLPNIFCKSGLVLVFKISDGSPACMKSETAQKLVERGWGVLNEQTVWFEYTPLQCQQTPWDEHWNKLESARNMTSVMYRGPELGVIKMYFKDQGIVIIDAKYTPAMQTSSEPRKTCGEPINYYAFYFLVSESDANKMSSLGYKKLDVMPSSSLSVEGLR
ncbi:MAG: hypothetical protein HY223_10305 [Thaumarchaeota archaeon]|nr:hypothetical protein [Nitrososphaerota archaeon]